MRRLVLLAALVSGCSFVTWLGVQLYYVEVPLSGGTAHRGLVYRASAGTRLDLYAPEGGGWPVVIFAYGGGWRTGSRGLVAGGADVYQNIGRFLMSRGVGAAIIDYRLQPEVTWREQVDDVSAATLWVYANVQRYGGDPTRLLLAGHSAGSQLTAFTILEHRELDALGMPADAVCGLVAVSGAGFQLDDEETYRLGGSREYFEERFRPGSAEPDWRHEASARNYVTGSAPPLLAIYTDGDSASLQRQMRLLIDRYKELGLPHEVVVAPGENHYSMVIALSRPGDVVSEHVAAFARACPFTPART